MIAGVKAKYWAVIGADKRADSSPNWASENSVSTIGRVWTGLLDCGGGKKFIVEVRGITSEKPAWYFQMNVCKIQLSRLSLDIGALHIHCWWKQLEKTADRF